MIREWAAHVEWFQALSRFKPLGHVAGIDAVARQIEDGDKWSDGDSKKFGQILKEFGLGIHLHYFPQLNAWSVSTKRGDKDGEHRLVSMAETRCIHRATIAETKKEQVEIRVYVRTADTLKKPMREPTICFCFMHYSGTTLLNKEQRGFVVAEYPLPYETPEGNKTTDNELDLMAQENKRDDIRRAQLGWNTLLSKADGFDTYTDYFGDTHFGSASRYASDGIEIFEPSL